MIPRALARLPRMSFPTPRQAAIYVATALSIGIIVGAAIGPSAPQAKQVLLGSTGTASAHGGAPSPAPADAPAALGAPTGDVAADSPPSAPAPASAASAPAAPDAAPAVEPAVPLGDAPLAAGPAPQAGQPSDESDLAGTVVHTNPAAGSYTLATAQGEMIAVHTAKLPDPGVKVRATIRHLANGSMSEVKRTDKGSERTAKLGGTVTYVAEDGKSYVVSVRGVSLLVTAPDFTVGERPKLRSLVTLGVRLEDPPSGVKPPVILRETTLKLEGDATGPVELEGKVAGVDASARTITLSADDRGDTRKDLTLTVPGAIDLGRFKRGDVLIAVADVNRQGAYTLTGSWQDGDAHRADDPANALGDQKP